jgi:ketosteroid isomerase-like protein
MEPEREACRWTDVVAIQQLVVAFCDAVTRGDWDRYESLWAPDGVWEEDAPFAGRFEGASAIRSAAESSTARVQLYAQTAHGTLVDELGEATASARTTIRGLSVLDGRTIENLGIYHDVLVRLDDGWRFQRRFLQNLFVAEGDLTGTVMVDRARIREAVPRPGLSGGSGAPR